MKISREIEKYVDDIIRMSEDKRVVEVSKEQ